MLSKVVPVGERALEIERNISNAGTEKIFTESAVNNIAYIDHGNLADRGSIIKDLYRPDQLHLSQDGVYKFTGSLKDAILDVLHGKRESAWNDAKRQNSDYETDRNRSHNINTENRYQRDYIREHDRYTPREQRQRGYVRAGNAEYYEDEKSRGSYRYQRMMITRIIMLMKGDDVMTIITTTGIRMNISDITTKTRNHNMTTDGEIIMKVKVTIDMITITKIQCS